MLWGSSGCWTEIAPSCVPRHARAWQRTRDRSSRGNDNEKKEVLIIVTLMLVLLMLRNEQEKYMLDYVKSTRMQHRIQDL